MTHCNIHIGKRSPMTLVAIFLALLMAYAVPCVGASPEGPPATVAAIEGPADLDPDGEAQPRSLSRGITVNPWDTVSTQGKAKLLLTWTDGLTASLAEFSSLLYSPDEGADGWINEIQLMEGVVRVATEGGEGRDVPRYFVSTPLAYVQPENFNEPADFIVEVYDPSKTVVTVVSGRVKIKGPEGRQWTEKTVLGCKTAFIEEGKDKMVVLSAGTDDLNRLITATTIPGTLTAHLDACRPSSARGPEPLPPVTEIYSDYPEYYEEVWDVVEFPYWDIRVIGYHGGYCEIWIPGVGHFFVPIPVGGGWVYDPAVVEVYARYAFCQRALLYDRYYWRNLRMKRRELHNMIHLARQAGNVNLLAQLNRRLDYVNVRTDWANRRINRLERRVGEIQEKRQRFAGQLPRNFDLFQKISDSFDSQRNLKVMQGFQNQIQNRVNLQNQLAGMAGQEIASLRNRIAGERDPLKRMALRNELGKIRGEVSEGRLPLTRNQEGIRKLLTQAGKGAEGEKQDQARQQLLSRLEKQKLIHQNELVNQKTLADVRLAVEKKTDPRTRQRLERRLGEIQQSVEARRQDEAQLQKIERMTAEAAKEGNPEKRREILGTLRELSKPSSGIGLPGATNLIQQQRNLEQQLVDVKDKQKRDAIQRNIEELKGKQQEQVREQQLEQERRVRQQVIGDRDRTKPADLKRPGEQRELDSQADQRLKQQEEGKRQAEQKLREQQEKTRQSDTLRKQQEQQRQEVEQKARQQQEKARQSEQMRQQQERTPQADTVRKQQEQQRREAEQKARQAEQARQQQLRQQQERTRQADTVRKQQEQQRREAEQKARQAEQARQQQLRQQQERTRQADTVRKQQEQQRQQQQIQQQQRQQQQRQQQQIQQQQMRQQQELKKRLEQKPAPR